MVFSKHLASSLSPLFLCASILLGAPVTTWAKDIVVTVRDKNGAPVEDVLVMISSPKAVDSSTEASKPNDLTDSEFVMDQIDSQFVPNLLVVPVGAKVSFPNSDVVAHHVYSFSRPNNFVLPLYHGDAPEPITFENPGIVVVGCNIHDHMIAHIVVTNSPNHGFTSADGQVVLESSEAEPSVQIWSPRIRTRGESLVQVANDNAALFQLTKKLRPPISSEPHSSRYR